MTVDRVGGNSGGQYVAVGYGGRDINRGNGVYVYVC